MDYDITFHVTRSQSADVYPDYYEVELYRDDKTDVNVTRDVWLQPTDQTVQLTIPIWSTEFGQSPCARVSLQDTRGKRSNNVQTCEITKCVYETYDDEVTERCDEVVGCACSVPGARNTTLPIPAALCALMLCARRRARSYSAAC
jgi:hypothetical protein